MTDTPYAIDVTDLTVAYQEKPVLWDIDLQVPPGILMAIVGPNGAGKTTFIKAVLDLIKPVAGQTLIYGKPTSSSGGWWAMCPSAAVSTGTSPPACSTWS